MNVNIAEFKGQKGLEGLLLSLDESFDKSFTLFDQFGNPVKTVLVDVPLCLDKGGQFPFVPYGIAGNLFLRGSYCPSRVKSPEGAKVEVHFSSVESSICNLTQIYPTIAALLALKEVDLIDKIILDLGSADGILSSLALKQGARYTLGVDNDKSYRNVYPSSAKSSFVHGNITQRDSGIVRRIRKLRGAEINLPPYLRSVNQIMGLDKVNVVVSNIGPHPIYAQAHLDAIDSLDHLPNAAIFVAGGYYGGVEGINTKPALDRLKAKGFSLDYYVVGEDNVRTTAFVVRK